MSFVLEQVMKSRESLPSHPLFQATRDLHTITSPAEVGYHPDSVLSALDYFSIYSKNMRHSGVRGEDFVAIRCAPQDAYDLAHAKVECVFLRHIEGEWTLRKENRTISEEEFQRFELLAQNKTVVLNNQVWKRI